GAVGREAGLTSVAIVGVGVALVGLAGSATSLIAGLVLLRRSFGWAQEAADEQLRVAGRTRRFFPAIVGEGIEAAEEEMRPRMGAATALFGSAADSMQEQITRRFTEFRFGRGLRGEADIFRRWGITPQAVQRAERVLGTRMDLTSWLEAFTLKR